MVFEENIASYINYILLLSHSLTEMQLQVGTLWLMVPLFLWSLHILNRGVLWE
jgi:hypothetical protein